MSQIRRELIRALGHEELRRNALALLKFLLLGVAVVVAYSLGFLLLMWFVEGERYSLVSALYWTVVTMTTLGFGDIVFETDVGRAYSTLVLVSGVFVFLVFFPFVFIRHFYAPWLEARVRLRAPTDAPPGTSDHVIICREDTIAPTLMEQLRVLEIPHLLLERDPERAGRMADQGVPVVTGDPEEAETYRHVAVRDARLVFANGEDVENTNITLTVREAAPDVPIAAIISNDDSEDILELAGCTHILPLRRRLGQHLAQRVNAGHAQTHEIGRFRDLVVAEFPVLNTPLAGKTIRETRLRESLGLNVIGVWEAAELRPAHPDYVLGEKCLPVVVGTPRQMQELDELLYIYDTNWEPVLVLGGGKVGRAATRALKEKGVPVHIIERKPELAARIEGIPDQVFVGDAANRSLLLEAGLEKAPAVLLTTNDDAMNIYLAAYCRGLRPDVRIVSRITHERNMRSIRRAGADLALSYAELGTESVLALAQRRDVVLIGTGVELLKVELPRALAGLTLAESGIGAQTGLTVVAIETPERILTDPDPEETLPENSRLHVIGTAEQVEGFKDAYLS